MKNERKLMLCCTGSKRDVPYVRIKGRWFRDYGFSPGDQVLITSPQPNILLMTIHKTAVELENERDELRMKIKALSRSR